MSLFDRFVQTEATRFDRRASDRAVAQPDVFEDYRPGVVQVNIRGAESGVVMFWNFDARRVMDSLHFDVIVFKLQFVSFRSDFHRVLGDGGAAANR